MRISHESSEQFAKVRRQEELNDQKRTKMDEEDRLINIMIKPVAENAKEGIVLCGQVESNLLQCLALSC